jgi:hypothetical protein
VLARIRDLNRLELAGETVRAALEMLAAAAPGWLAAVIDASWQRVYGQRIDSLRLPELRRLAMSWRTVRQGRLFPAGTGIQAGRACHPCLVPGQYRVRHAVRHP